MSTPTRFISTRQTRSGDFLIFEAVPYRLGIGTKPVGDQGPGYTTGHQFGRADTGAEAVAAAEAIVSEKSDDFCHWVLIEWQPPTEQNPQFVDLPIVYPSQTEYETKSAADEDGWIYINPTKTLEWYRGRAIKCVDVSGPNSFGYDFAVKISGEQVEFARTKTVWINGKFSARFQSGTVVNAILSARAWIDDDLITVKEAAHLVDKSIQSVSNMVARGTLTGYDNDKAPKRQGGTLVSRAELERLGLC
jgi:hypothetical protein